MTTIQPLKNDESFWVGRDVDDKKVRDWFQVDICPAPESCSAKCFKRACCWSYESRDKVLSYLKYHLIYQGNHNLSDAQAEELAYSAEITENLENYEERETYRV